MKEKKPLTIQDATKAELIEYFFSPISGGFRIGADQQKFLLWLENHRREKNYKKYSDLQDAATESLDQYVNLLERAKKEPDDMKRLDILTVAGKYFKQYEKLQAQAEKAAERI